MIPVARVPEPTTFDAEVRKRGNAWLAEHPGATRPRDFWSPFRGHLAKGFEDRCAYSAMRDLVGTVDHHRSHVTHPDLTYEWSNYRYASQWINSCKKDHAVLDPHEVGDGWFEVLLPSLQLVVTDKVPEEHRALAQRTLALLHLSHDERILRQRRAWYSMYQQKKLSLEGLREVAPLIAAAEDKRLAALAAR